MVLLNMASSSVLGMSMKAAKIAAEGNLSLRGRIGFQSSGIFVKLSEAILWIFPVLFQITMIGAWTIWAMVGLTAASSYYGSREGYGDKSKQVKGIYYGGKYAGMLENSV